MNAENTPRPDLTQEEWRLLAELLRQELTALPGEIHHTDSRDYRDHLHERRDLVSRALLKIEAVLKL